MALVGVLGDVTQETVRGSLLERNPELLDSAVPRLVVAFEQLVTLAGAEVRIVVGPNPPAGPIRELAALAIATETASLIEYAEYPEQQLQGGDGRGYFLHQKYLELLGSLRAWVAAHGGTVPDDGGVAPAPLQGLPRARFQGPTPYPDPAIVRGVSHPAGVVARSALAEETW